MQRRYLTAIAGSALLLLALLVSACGGDDQSTTADEAGGQSTDGAFIVGMTAHHDSAIEMAEIASERAEQPEVQELARNIIASQGAEVAQMDEVHQRLFDEPANQGDHGTLGLSAAAMGMEQDMAVLENAKPFDREFIDMMIPHHQGAIRMARLQLADGEDSELGALAEAIIEAQSTEIEQMNEWRQKWYGAPSPAGGVPSEGDEQPIDSMDGMEH